MKQLFLLAVVILMFVSCVDKKEQVQEEEILIEELDSNLVEETETFGEAETETQEVAE